MNFSRSNRAAAVKFALVSAGTLFGVVASNLTGILADVLGLGISNVILSAVVLAHGFFVLRHIWRIEMREGRATIPFAWAYFATQHLTFGLGGFIASISNFGYFYENDQGVFAWSEAIPLMLMVHAASMIVGLLGVTIGITSKAQPRRAFDRVVGFQSSIWSWQKSRITCFVSLAVHMLVWVVFARFILPGFLGYAVQAIAYCANATFVLWGLGWSQCAYKAKIVFLTYSSAFVLLELVEGNRTFFIVPAMLFAVGLTISPVRPKFRTKTLVWAAPCILFLSWGFVRSEDLRMVFTRTTTQDLGDTMQRVESLGQSVERDLFDAAGQPLNAAFRLGSRLFEPSAADVIMRTPSSLPYWGWSEEDSSILLTGALPLKLNPDATFSHSETSGVLFLRSYGWAIDPDGGSAMPATLIADSWRRFSWAGVVAVYLVWAWLLAKATLTLRFKTGQIVMAIFSSSVLSNAILQYTNDVTSLFSSIPRRLLVIGVYTVIVFACGAFSEERGLSAWSLRRATVLPGRLNL